MRRILLMMLVFFTLTVPAPGQRRRTAVCRVAGAYDAIPPEAQLAINDMVLIIVECPGDRHLLVPGRRWPTELSTDTGTRVTVVVNKTGTPIGLKVGKKVVLIPKIPRHLL